MDGPSKSLFSFFVFLRAPWWAVLYLLAMSGCASFNTANPGSAGQKLLASDDFQNGLGQWSIEIENGGSVAADHGILDIDVPAGATVWFKPLIKGPLMIEYRATAVSAGGPNDRVSDLNCFWMARDSRNPQDIFAVTRSGKFADYNWLCTYYVGLGGNGNTTTRFRRYIGSATTRPLLPGNDLRDKTDLLVPNQEQTIMLIADGHTIEYFRNGHRLFWVSDHEPYTSGWFAFRTTASHLRIRDFRVYSFPSTQELTRRHGEENGAWEMQPEFPNLGMGYSSASHHFLLRASVSPCLNFLQTTKHFS